MITRLLGLLLRVLLEASVILLVCGLVLLALGWRVGRRLVVDRPDGLERVFMGPSWVPAAMRLGEALFAQARGRVDSPQNVGEEEGQNE